MMLPAATLQLLLLDAVLVLGQASNQGIGRRRRNHRAAVRGVHVNRAGRALGGVLLGSKMKSQKKGGSTGMMMMKAKAGGKKGGRRDGGDHDGGSSSGALVDVTISVQPDYSGIPMYAAYALGWFEQMGINANLTMYDSGAPQVRDAVENAAWDIGVAGGPPNVLGSSQGIWTIALSNDEAPTTRVSGAPGVTEWPPTNVSAGMFGATSSSTGDFVMRLCLEEAGINVTDDLIQDKSQGEIIAALEQESSPATMKYGALWSPNSFAYSSDNPAAQAVCSGSDLGVRVLNGVMARAAYATEHGETVARVLAAFLRAVTFMQNAAALDAAVAVSESFYYDFAGLSSEDVQPAFMRSDINERPIYDVDEQLFLMRRGDNGTGQSIADKSYGELEEFLLDQGVIEAITPPREWINDEYLKMVSEHKDLRMYSYLGAIDSGMPQA